MVSTVQLLGQEPPIDICECCKHCIGIPHLATLIDAFRVQIIIWSSPVFKMLTDFWWLDEKLSNSKPLSFQLSLSTSFLGYEVHIMSSHFHFWNLCLDVVLPDGIGRVGGILKANGEVVQLSEMLQA